MSNLARLILTVVGISIALTSRAEAPALLWEVSDNFKNPESVVFDKRTKLLFVSNVNGAPNEFDGNGYISILSAKGKMITANWVEG